MKRFKNNHMECLQIHLSELDKVDRSTVHLGDTVSLKPAVLFVPSHMVSTFCLDVSSVPSSYLQDAVPNLLEESLAEPISKLTFRYNRPVNGLLDVLVCKSENIEQWQELARISGYRFKSIYPDFYLVEVGGVFEISSDKERYQVARTGPHSGLSGSPENVSKLLDLIPAEGDGYVFSEIKESWESLCEQGVLLDLDKISLVEEGGAATAYVTSRRIKRTLGVLGLLGLTSSSLLFAWGHHYQTNAITVENAVFATYEDLLGAPPDSMQEIEGIKQRLGSVNTPTQQKGLVEALRRTDMLWTSGADGVLLEFVYTNGVVQLTVEGNAQSVADLAREQQYFAQVSITERGQNSIIKLTLPSEFE